MPQNLHSDTRTFSASSPLKWQRGMHYLVLCFRQVFCRLMLLYGAWMGCARLVHFGTVLGRYHLSQQCRTLSMMRALC